MQYDHIYVQQEPLLLFRRIDKNCCINIIEHTPAKTITSTCMFLYYHKIIVHASLVTTSYFFYLLNINDELKITCRKYGRQTTNNTVSPISVKQLDTIIGNLRQNKIYLSKSGKIGQDIKHFNESIMDNFENMNEQLDIDSCFDEESSMIFIFMSCIIALLAFILLAFLCFKHEKLRKLISLYMASPQVVNAAALDSIL